MVLVGATLLNSELKADIDVYSFSDEQNRQQYLDLTKQLRCPKCQNQDIADSNAPIASDMRREVHRLVEDGQSKDEIVAFMVDRFGEFVTYKPKLIPATYLLWFGPWILVLLGLILITVLAKRRHSGQKNPGADSETIETELNVAQQREQLDKLMNLYASDGQPDKEQANDSKQRED